MTYVYDLNRANADAFQGTTWKIWLFDFVDDVRRAKNCGLIPNEELSWPTEREAALVHSVCCALLDELDPTSPWPDWLSKSHWLKEPWFVAGKDSLIASAILESPVWFRQNNIWVMGNFLSRV